MKTQSDFDGQACAGSLLRILSVVCLLVGFLMTAGPAMAHGKHGGRVAACGQTSQAALTACRNSASSDYWLGLGNCDNISGPGDKRDCLKEVATSLKEDYKTCYDQFAARQQVCRELGQGPYDPDLSSDNFVESEGDLKGNTYFPLTSGKKYTYQSILNDVVQQTIEDTVLDTTTIDGILCRKITDRVFDGDTTVADDHKLLEDTIDWYAQDNNGNVWYFGETTIAYTFDDAGNPTASTEGSWMTGTDEAKPGIIMFDIPDAKEQLGKLYRQEFSLGTAEDLGRNIEVVDNLPSLPKGVSLPTGVTGPYLHTQDSSSLEPGVIEDKYYAPNVGVVLTVDPDGTQEVLIKIE
jgi:hypothetical protein